jgi:hypothetical protein
MKGRPVVGAADGHEAHPLSAAAPRLTTGSRWTDVLCQQNRGKIPAGSHSLASGCSPRR